MVSVVVTLLITICSGFGGLFGAGFEFLLIIGNQKATTD